MQLLHETTPPLLAAARVSTYHGPLARVPLARVPLARVPLACVPLAVSLLSLHRTPN